jgi:UDP-N-acetylmuramoyl-L-alanyl-D-glutamate--2,6-diaminopimelate ligase
MTTPDAPALHQFLRAALDRGANDVILEVSSHALELGRIGGLLFETAAITNITPDHIDFHGSFEAYTRVKASLLQHLAPGGLAVLNHDDPVVYGLPGRDDVPHIDFGLSPGAEIRARIRELGVHHSRWEWFRQGDQMGEIRLPLPAAHNVMNALAALAMAMHAHVDPLTAAQALQDFSPAPRRLETVSVGDYTIVTDVAMNRGSYHAVMTWVQEIRRPLVVVNAIRGNRGPLVNRDIADVLADWNARLHFAPLVVSLSESHVARMAVDYRVRCEESDAFINQARRGGLALEIYRELPEALDQALNRLRPGGVLLLLGTFGMDDGLRLAQANLAKRMAAK